MPPIELLLIRSVRVLVEVALLALLGQGLLALLAGAGRQNNPVYRLFSIVTAPVIRVVRWLAPCQVLDRHVPWVAGFGLFWLWIWLAWIKRTLCQIDGVVC